MRNVLIAAAMAVCLVLALAPGCAREENLAIPNTPPETYIAIADTVRNTTVYIQHLHWWGDDIDGEVIGYEYRWFMDEMEPGCPTDTDWVFTGETADLRSQLELEPIMSQFGWQFETQVVSLTGGHQALLEWIILLGGLEQNENNASLAWLAGYRLANGLEFGVGPSFSANFSQDVTNSSMVVAGGATLPFGDLYIPMNMAVAFSDGGPRLTTLLGWIVG